MITERERHGPREVLDRADLLEDLFQTGLLGEILVPGGLLRCYPATPALVAQQPVERVGLEGEEAGDLKRFLDTGKGNTTWTRNGG